MKNLIQLLLLCACCGITSAAEGQDGTDRREGAVYRTADPKAGLVEEGHSWLLSRNPAAIGLRTLPDMGNVLLAGEHLSGSLHRLMETGVRNSWGFRAASYQALKKVNLWGGFSFRESHHMDRAFSDNFNPYNGNPYQAGSPIPGDYTGQRFDFGARISSLAIGERLWLGMGMDYSIGDLSRTNDPRSRVQMIDLQCTPGFILQLSPSHRLGADLLYSYGKEKNNPYVSRTADGKEFLLYLQEGLGVFRRLVSTAFDRRNVCNRFGGSLQYEHLRKGASLFADLGYTRRKDRIEDRMQESPGGYSDNVYRGRLRSLWEREGSRHTAGLVFRLTRGKASKAFQELVSETDPETKVTTSRYVTLFTSPAFRHTDLHVSAAWRHTRTEGQDYRHFIGAEAGFRLLKDSYIFYTPSSHMKTASTKAAATAGIRLLSKDGHRFYAEGSAGCIFNLKGDYFISPELEDQELRTAVHDPDYAVFSGDMLHFGLRLQYFHPLTDRFDLFASLQGNCLLSLTDHALKRYLGNLSVGISRRF